MKQMLPEPCWRIERNDPWEITHHATRADAEADHADLVRADYGWPLSTEGTLQAVPGVAVRETIRCYVLSCPKCGTEQHVQGSFDSCVEGCDLDEASFPPAPAADPDHRHRATPLLDSQVRS